MSQVIPFDTGKVKIGVYYQRPTVQPMSRDALDLQDALLRDKRRRASPARGSFFSSVVGRLQQWVAA